MRVACSSTVSKVPNSHKEKKKGKKGKKISGLEKLPRIRSVEGIVPNSHEQKKKGKEEGVRKSARWRSH